MQSAEANRVRLHQPASAALAAGMKLANSGLRLERPRLQLGVVLHADKPRMAGISIVSAERRRATCREDDALVLEPGAIGGVDLVAWRWRSEISVVP